MHLLTKYFIKTIGFLIVIISPVFSQQGSLAQYIHQAQENNPAIIQAYNQWQSAEAAIAVAKGLPNPTFSFGYFLENVETAAGPQEYKIGLMQKFPFLGKRKFQGKIQAAKAEKAYYTFQKKRLSLNHEIRSTWYNYYYLVRITDLTNQNFDLIQNWDNVIRSKYVTAQAGHPDLIKTQIELIQLEDELSTLENKKAPLLEQFRNLLNDKELSNITVPDSLNYSQNDMDPSDLLAEILEGSPDLLLANSEIDLRKARVKRSKLNRMPDIGVGMEKITTGEKEGSAFSGKDPLVAKLSLDIPLWFRKNNASIASANFALVGAERQVSSVENDLKTQFENVLFDIAESTRQIELYKHILIPKGLESLGATEIAYRADKIEFLSLVDAQRRLLQFQMKYEKALVDYLKAKSKLSILTGEGLS
jgi:outer membrane protein TolC